MSTQEKETIGLRPIIIYYLLHWKLFVITFLCTLLPAVMYLVFYPHTYEFASRFKIHVDDQMSGSNAGGLGGNAANLMSSFGLNGSSAEAITIDDELVTLQSHDLLTQVVNELGLNAQYKSSKFSFYKRYTHLPFVLKTDSATFYKQEESIAFSVQANTAGLVTVEAKAKHRTKNYTFKSLPATLSFYGNRFILSYGDVFIKGEKASAYITMQPPGTVADDLADELTIDAYSKSSNVIELFYTDYEIQRGRDLLNCIIQHYNQRADTLQDLESSKTVRFLNRRINKIIANLSLSEEKIEQFKQTNKITDLETDVQFYADQMKDLQTKMIEFQAQRYAIKLITEFVSNPANKYNLIPEFMSMSSGEQKSSVSLYNEALVERQRMLLQSNPENPLIISANEQLAEMRGNVKRTIDNALKSLDLTLNNLRAKENVITSKFGKVPSQEREYLEFKRQQEILQGVYLVLLQKREEALLRIGKDIDRAQVIDQAYRKARPIAPRKLFAAIAMLIFTIIVPVTWLFCKEQYDCFKKELKETTH